MEADDGREMWHAANNDANVDLNSGRDDYRHHHPHCVFCLCVFNTTIAVDHPIDANANQMRVSARL